ncbi:HNH endonuclease, partial [Paenarthrobacter sp. NPDC057981]
MEQIEGGQAIGTGAPLSGVADCIVAIGSFPLSAHTGELIDQLRELEDLKSAICGLQARVAVAFDAAQRASE